MHKTLQNVNHLGRNSIVKYCIYPSDNSPSITTIVIQRNYDTSKVNRPQIT